MNNMYQAYKKAARATTTPRETEARVLTEGAMKLIKYRDDWDEEKDRRNKEKKAELNEALVYNQKVWTVLQSALTSSDCPLPDDLRKKILRLSLFVDLQIFKAMAAPSPDVLAHIIDINLGLAKGLSTNPESSDETPELNPAAKLEIKI